MDTMDELTFSFWNGEPDLAFSDICLATKMHLEGQKRRRGAKQGWRRKTVFWPFFLNL